MVISMAVPCRMEVDGGIYCLQLGPQDHMKSQLFAELFLQRDQIPLITFPSLDGLVGSELVIATRQQLINEDGCRRRPPRSPPFLPHSRPSHPRPHHPPLPIPSSLPTFTPMSLPTLACTLHLLAPFLSHILAIVCASSSWRGGKRARESVGMRRGECEKEGQVEMTRRKGRRGERGPVGEVVCRCGQGVEVFHVTDVLCITSPPQVPPEPPTLRYNSLT
jgi:hypothetical protein